MMFHPCSLCRLGSSSTWISVGDLLFLLPHASDNKTVVFIIMHLEPVFMKRLRSSAVVTQRKFRIPSLPVLVSFLVVLALLILGIQNRGDLTVLSDIHDGRVPFSKSEDAPEKDCFEQNPWVRGGIRLSF